MAIITLSKEYAAESDVLAEKLSKRLGYDILDKQFIQFIAQEMRVPSSELVSYSRLRASRLLQLVDKSVLKTFHEATVSPSKRIDDSRYFSAVKTLIEKAAQQNNVIIVGWGGQCILAQNPKAIHIRVVKNIEERISILKQQFGLDDRSARELIEREEGESARYIETYFNRLWDDPHLYHLVLNLSKISFEQAVNIIESMVRDIEEQNST
ncbi:MAG: cytidylate kinase-like family protein [Thermodesulforhabdaceae bacterium]